MSQLKDKENDEEPGIPICALTEESDPNNQETKAELSPYLPTYEQWKQASLRIPKEDEHLLVQSKEGLYYSIKGRQLYVPAELRESIMNYFHTGRYGGHFGINKTARKILQWFYWPKLKRDLGNYIDCCLSCKRTGAPAMRYLRKTLERPEPFQLVSLDFIGPREWAAQKVNYLVILDHYSRFLVAEETPDQTAESAIRKVKENWIRHYSVPEIILVDRGPAFMSQKFKNFICAELAIQLVYSGAGYPQGNALNESAHKGLEASIVNRRQYDT